MSLINQFIKSLYSSKDMALYRFQKVWKSIIYIILLSIIATIPVAITTTNIMNDEIAQIEDLFNEQIPSFTLTDGKLTAENDIPIKEEDSNFTFIFDSTTSKLDTSVDENDILVAFLEDKLIFQTPGYAEETVSYSNFGNITITKDTVLSWFNDFSSLHSYIFSIVFVVTFILSCLMKFLYTTIFAFFLPLIANSWKKKLTYVQSWNLMACILTIPTVFFCIMDTLEIYVPYSVTLQTFIIFVLMYTIIRELPKSNK